VKTISDALGVARSNLVAQAAPTTTLQRCGRRPQPDGKLLAEIKGTIAVQPTYGYLRIHALIRRRRAEEGHPPVNVKRVYRVRKARSLLLERHTGSGVERRHDGRVVVDRPDTRWCSDGFEIGCDNGERVRVAAVRDRDSSSSRVISMQNKLVTDKPGIVQAVGRSRGDYDCI
jgi:putative transposase